jgi:cobalamin biosynthetic protein CobC
MLLEHGGRLRQAAARYNIPLNDWIDLSTGINPHGWPVPAIPAAVWNRLPEDEDNLIAAACDYYSATTLLPVAGSQAAIQTLPQLRAPSRVAVISPGYNEHAHGWQRAGHDVTPVSADQLNTACAEKDIVVIIHPNNPTGARFSTQQLLDWHQQLSTRGGWLVIDEAFMDTTPEHSIAKHTPLPGLIVLRSLGKFFGLAGARVGFVLAETQLLDQMKQLLGPWSISAPARYVAAHALMDKKWQSAAREQLSTEGRRLTTLLSKHGFNTHGCALFQWLPTEDAVQLHEHLARQGILTRLFQQLPSVRFGLPGTESGWERLDVALAAYKHRGDS